MKICLNCKEVISDDEVMYRKEYMGECHGIPAYQTVAYCPICGDIEIINAWQCSICGEWFKEDDLKAGACNKCHANTVRAFIDMCTAHFSQAEGRVINQAFDGEYIFAEVEE